MTRSGGRLEKRPGDEAGDPFDLGGATETRVGRMRAPTSSEEGRPDVMFRADAVLRLAGEVVGDATSVEKHVASLIDGTRPVARLRAKSGLSLEDLRVALAMLVNRRALALAGIIEYVAAAADGADAADVIPPHVMREMQAMIDEEEKNRALDDGSGEFGDEATTEMPVLPDDDEDDDDKR